MGCSPSRKQKKTIQTEMKSNGASRLRQSTADRLDQVQERVTNLVSESQSSKGGTLTISEIQRETEKTILGTKDSMAPIQTGKESLSASPSSKEPTSQFCDSEEKLVPLSYYLLGVIDTISEFQVDAEEVVVPTQDAKEVFLLLREAAERGREMMKELNVDREEVHEDVADVSPVSGGEDASKTPKGSVQDLIRKFSSAKKSPSSLTTREKFSAKEKAQRMLTLQREIRERQTPSQVKQKIEIMEDVYDKCETLRDF